MRLRQLVFVSKERDRLAKEICDVFDLKEAYNAPGLISFGLENVLIPLNDTFFEIVTPVQENTTAERFFEKTGGEGGYMIIVDGEDFEHENERVENSEIRIIWNGDRQEEGIHARTIHLHPKQMGGAILSLDWMNPKESWKWAGPEWTSHISGPITGVDGVQIQSDNPEAMFQDWLEVLGNPKSNKEMLKIFLDHTWLEFILDSDGRGPVISAFSLKAKDHDIINKRAAELVFIS